MPDYTVDDTVYKRFTTRQFSDGVPTTLAGTPVVSAYEDDSAVQITAGITLGVDHDGVSGLNLLTVVATGANGFEAGKSYDLVITTGTVGGVSVVGEVVWHFTLSAEAAAVDLANGTDGLGAIKAETASILADTAEIGTAGVGLTNIDLPNQTMDIVGNITGNLSGSVGSLTTNNDKTGYALSATGLDAIVSTATGMVEIAKAVWDRVLSGATHNIATSAGRRLRTLQDFGVYEGGAVWLDTVNGTAGTVDFENGTVTNPSLTIADALTIAGSVGLSVIHVLPGSSFTPAASMAGFEIIGYGYTIALNGQSFSGALIQDATVTGNDSGSNAISTVYRRCIMGTNTLGAHSLQGCRLGGTITLQEAADYFWDQCISAVAGTGTPAIDFQAAAETKNLSVRHYSGGLEFQNFGNTGTHTGSIEGHGQVVLNANCAGGTLAIRGSFTVTDNAGGAVTLSDDARIDVAQINAECDTALADYDGPTNAEMEARTLVAASYFDPAADTVTNVTTVGSVSGSVASVTGNVAGSVGSLGATAKSDVNAEVADVIDTDTSGEPAQGSPPATASLRTKLDYVYKFLRNRVTTTATTISVYNDAASVVDHKSTHSDDATTYDRGEFVSGP